MSLNQEFPTSVEAQILERGSDNQPTAVLNLCNSASGTTAAEPNNCSGTNASAPLTKRGDWFRVEVLVLADSVAKFILNGDTVGVFTKFKLSSGGAPLKEGRIALQMESHPVDFRKIEMVNLKGCMDKAAANYKDYYIASDPASCVALASQNRGQSEAIRFRPSDAVVEVPLSGSYRIVVTDIRGAEVYAIEGAGPRTYTLKPHLSEGIQIVSVLQGERAIARKAFVSSPR
jgi:hypothetical protein